MTWLAICEDVDNGSEVREKFLAEHLQYIETILHKIEVAGPLNTEQEPEYTSSAFIYKVDSEAEALTLLKNDPYSKAGLYREVKLKQFQPVVGNWVGGKTW